MGISVRVIRAIVVSPQCLSFVRIKLREHFRLRVVTEGDEAGFSLTSVSLGKSSCKQFGQMLKFNMLSFSPYHRVG